MAFNPNNAPTGSLNSVATGKGAGSFAVSANILNLGSHVAGRRMGIYNAQPVCTPADGLETWDNGSFTGSYYVIHGTRYQGTYDEVAASASILFGGLTRDQGLKGTTIHYDFTLNYNEAPTQIYTRGYVEGQLTSSYSSGPSNPFTETSNALSGTVFTSYNYSTFQQGAGAYYNPANYNAFISDNGYFQFTTKDLASPNAYLNRSVRTSTVINGFTGSILPQSYEEQTGSVVGNLKINIPTSNVTSNWTTALGYVPQLLAYPTDYVSE